MKLPLEAHPFLRAQSIRRDVSPHLPAPSRVQNTGDKATGCTKTPENA